MSYENDEKYSINIDQVTEIETLFNAGWLFQDMKGKEIILETSELEFSPIELKLRFIILCEGILNSNRRKPEDPKIDINYDEFEFTDLEMVARTLTEITGVHFSTSLVF